MSETRHSVHKNANKAKIDIEVSGRGFNNKPIGYISDILMVSDTEYSRWRISP